MAKSIKTQLREIAEAEKITDKQKALIIVQSEAMGVEFVERGKCGDCYKDQAVRLWAILAEKDEKKNKSRRYLLRPGKDVFWRNIRVNATLSDEELAGLLENGFPRQFFARIDGVDL